MATIKQGKNMKLYASIHVGSYGISMKVFEIKRGGGIKIIDSKRKRIEISRDIYESGRISTENFFEIVNTLRDMKNTLVMYGVDSYDAYATASLEAADNLLTLIDQVKILDDLELEILDYSMQKYRLYMALCQDERFLEMIEDRCVLVDIGGVGVQLTLFDKGKLVATQHAKIGATDVWEDLRLIGQKSDYIEVLSQLLYKEIETYYTMYMGGKLPKSLVIINNPIGQISADNQGAEELSNGRDYLKRIKRLLKNSAYDVNGEGDEDISVSKLGVPFLLLYQSIMERLPVEEVYIAPISMHEGLAYNYAYSHKLIKSPRDFEDDVISASWALAMRYDGREKHLKTLEGLSVQLFDAIKKRHGLNSRARLLLRVAAILHDVGKYISLSDEANCTYTIIKSSHLLGVSSRERKIIAWACVFRQEGVYPYENVAEELDRDDYFLVRKLHAILDVAGTIDLSHRQKYKKIGFRYNGTDSLFITMDTQDSMVLESSIFRKKSEVFFDVFAITPILRRKRIAGSD